MCFFFLLPDGSQIIGPGRAFNEPLVAPLAVNQAHLQQLMDMGFTQEHCREALYYTTTVEQATEYLLLHPNTQSLSTAATATGYSSETLSTNTTTNSNVDSDVAASGTTSSRHAAENVICINDEEDRLPPEPRCYVNKKQRRGMAKFPFFFPNNPPMCEKLLTRFSRRAVDTCLFLIDEVPDTVYKGTELLAVLFRRNQDEWRVTMLGSIVNTILVCSRKLQKQIDDIGNVTTQLTDEPNEDEQALFYGATASQFNVRLHIFSLFLEGQYPDIRTPAVLSLKELNLIPELVTLFGKIEKFLTDREGKCNGSPKWLAQMILLIDLFEKVAVYTQRKNDMHIVTSRIWKWYDVASGKWNAYSVSNNKIINDAYWSGDSSVRVSVGRHRYTINFNCMSQVNEESGNHRPVILGLKSTARSSSEMVTPLYNFGESDIEYESDATSDVPNPKVS